MLYFNRPILSLLFICTVSNSFAQKTSHIKGQIIGEDKHAIPYVNISLHQANDGTLTKTIVADSTGHFIFGDTKAGDRKSVV